jgi:chain length determinant protein EpsF
MSFSQFLLILRARWVLVLGTLALFTIGVVVVGLLSEKLYTASASVVVDINADPDAAVTYAGRPPEDYMMTQVDIVTSERVARKVVSAMGLDQWPDLRQKWLRKARGRGDLTAWLAVLLQKRLTVVPAHESNVIDISVKWTDPKIAAALANGFAHAYIATGIELKVDPAKQYTSWYDERSRALRADLEAKQKRLSDFESEKGIIGADDRVDIENARLLELSSQLVVIQAQRQDSQSRQSQGSSDKDAIPDVLQNPLVATLKQSLAVAESRQQEIGSRLGLNHPEYIALQAQIAELRAGIASESQKIIDSLRRTTQVNERREGDVAAALAAQKKRVLELKHDRDEAAVMQNEVATAQRNLDTVTQRLAATSLESQTSQGNVVLLTAATEPAFPSSPIYVLDVALGLFLGAIIGIGAALGLELKNPRVRGDSEMVEILGVPLLGQIGPIGPRKSRGKLLSGPAVARLGTSAT